MRLNYFKTIAVSLLLVLLIIIAFKSAIPSKISDKDTPPTEFSTERALEHLKIISEKPHYTGSDAHNEVRDYLVTQLELLGLEPHVQEGFTINEKWNVLTKPQNIIARIQGSGEGDAVVLLAHYDSAPHSFSYGASDAGSGVVAILEGVRAYLAGGNIPKNDIIILFSDAEEIGLLGAKLFVNEHPWVNDVKLVVNFEARGSGGPSSMILETNGGNKNLIKEFIASKPSHPFASSLFYSIYKMLPNDTDSTVFREDADIDSYFFAFIDDHFDYHTANDTFENLDRNTLEHQGSYSSAIINHFSNSDLGNLKAETDDVYFNFPGIKMVSYPFSWIFPMLIIAWILFLIIMLLGILKRKFEPKMLVKGSLVFIKSLVVCGVLVFGLWKLLLLIYPGYKEILHGYTYNGSFYILAFSFFTVAWCFWFYRKYNHEFSIVSIYVFPIFIWLIINTFIAIYMKGAAFFIIPVYFALMTLFLLVIQTYKRPFKYILLSIPTLFIFVPLIRFFPVGLGLKMLFVSAIFTVLVFGLLIPVLVSFKQKRGQALLYFFLSFLFFSIAHFQSGFTSEREKPNSLVYLYDADDQLAYWATYDKRLDDWTEGFIDKEKNITDSLDKVPGSKYGTGFAYTNSAEVKDIPTAELIVISDTVVGNFREIALTILPQRKVHRIVMYSENEIQFLDFVANGVSWKKNPDTDISISTQKNRPFLNYYVTHNDSLSLQFKVLKDVVPQLVIQEISFDLATHPQFSIPKRPDHQMPKPFITTDAVIVQQSIDWLAKQETEVIPTQIEVE